MGWIDGYGGLTIVKRSVDIWLGCTSRKYVKEPVTAVTNLFDRLGVRSRVIDKKELCCGSVLYTTGQERGGNKNRLEVEKLLRDRDISEMVLLCPGCLRTFKDFYVPRRSNPLKRVYHYTEILAENIDDLKLMNPGRRREVAVTYHDPCHLGRHLGLFDAPRTLLKSIPKVKFIELPKSRDDSYCCGSGAGVRAYNKDLANYTSSQRLKEAKSVDAGVLVTSCPFCERSFLAAQEEDKDVKDIKVQNLAVFISQYI